MYIKKPNDGPRNADIPYDHYLNAADFIRRMHRKRRQISQDAYARLRQQAIEGDVIGAALGLKEALWEAEA